MGALFDIFSRAQDIWHKSLTLDLFFLKLFLKELDCRSRQNLPRSSKADITCCQK